MRLYHHPFSFNSRRPVMTALQLGIDLELDLIDLSKGAQRVPGFLEKNPNGKVPVLDDDGFLLWESHAIMQYLANKAPEQGLYPRELRARADVNRWLFWSAQHFSNAVSILGWERVVKPMLGRGEPDPAMEQRGEEQVTELARVLDGHLAGKEWIVGNRLTLADLAIASPLMFRGPARLPLDAFEHLNRWSERVQSLECWKKTNL